MKKIIISAMMLCLSCIMGSQEVVAACQKTQWLNGKKCVNCPANATCNGQVFKCNKNFAQNGAKCVQTTCQKGQWMNGSKCAACPANATCNDGRIFKCNKNFAQNGSKCVQTTCQKGQWMNGSKCTACPANATCNDGRTFTCNKNFAPQKNQCIATTCPKGQWMNGSKCAACPANATCNDGRTFTCNKNFAPQKNQCIATTCPKGQWMNGGKCAACPANATCNDGRAFKCNKNFAPSGNKCVPTACSKGQWLDGTVCVACPSNADCKDGKVFTCQTNYVQKGKTCAYQNAVAKNCEKYGSHVSHEWIEKREKNCVDCGIQADKDGRVVYYCYCGTGCSEAKGLSSAVGGKSGMKSKIDSCMKKSAKVAGVSAVPGGMQANEFHDALKAGKIKINSDTVSDYTSAQVGDVVTTTSGSRLTGVAATYGAKMYSCLSEEIVKKLHDKLKKAIKKIF